MLSTELPLAGLGAYQPDLVLTQGREWDYVTLCVGLPTQMAALAGIDLSADSKSISEAAVYQCLSLLTSLKNSSKLFKGKETRKSLKRTKNLMDRSWGQNRKVR